MRRVVTEEDLKQLVKNRETVRGGVDEHVGKALAARATQGRVSGRMPVSNPAPSPYRSKWEAAYASKLELEKRAGLIKAYWYEPFSLWLPGKVRYKPDFLVWQDWEHQLEVVEVKGWSKNLRDGMTRLKIAAAIFPCFTWKIVRMKRGGGFDGEYI